MQMAAVLRHADTLASGRVRNSRRPQGTCQSERFHEIASNRTIFSVLIFARVMRNNGREHTLNASLDAFFTTPGLSIFFLSFNIPKWIIVFVWKTRTVLLWIFMWICPIRFFLFSLQRENYQHCSLVFLRLRLEIRTIFLRFNRSPCRSKKTQTRREEGYFLRDWPLHTY